MIEFLVWLLFIVIVFGIILWAVSLVPMDAKLQQIARLIIVVILLLVLLSAFFGFLPLPHYGTTPVPLRRC